MARRIPARLTPHEGRRFGFTVGAAFLLLAAVSYWRGHSLSPQILGALGGTLVTLGLLIPGRLGPVFDAWMRLAHAMSKVTTPVFMGVVYFLVITPVGLVLRALGRNPLARVRDPGSAWVRHDPRSDAPGSMRRQF